MNLHTVYSLKLGFGCELKKNIVANLLVNSCKLFEKVWVELDLQLKPKVDYVLCIS